SPPLVADARSAQGSAPDPAAGPDGTHRVLRVLRGRPAGVAATAVVVPIRHATGRRSRCTPPPPTAVSGGLCSVAPDTGCTCSGPPVTTPSRGTGTGSPH